jgi:hypothetical protein
VHRRRDPGSDEEQHSQADPGIEMDNLETLLTEMVGLQGDKKYLFFRDRHLTYLYVTKWIDR